MPHKGERPLLMTMVISLSNEILNFLRASPNKDVTYETIHNLEFRGCLEKHFGKERAAKLFPEHDAAPEN